MAKKLSSKEILNRERVLHFLSNLREPWWSNGKIKNDENEQKRIDLKWKFFIRNPAYGEIVDKLEELNSLKEDINYKYNKWLQYFEKEILPKYPWIEENPVFIVSPDKIAGFPGQLSFYHHKLGRPLSLIIEERELSPSIQIGWTKTTRPSIRILLSSERGTFWHEIERDIDTESLEFIKDLRDRGSYILKFFPNLSIMGVDQRTDTITIQISLEHSKVKIIEDTKDLLNILDKEAKIFGLDLQRKKKRPTKKSDSIYQKYDLYLEVMKLRDDNRTPWKKIALEIYREEIDAGEMSLEKAKERVRKHYDQAVNLVNGGWRQI